ncbi:hypothetical protein C0J08_20770 [Marinomonas sp. CT5]|nr:hypothetical protein C0J08_20770 [Marinomonas sp. CT5]
MLIDAVLALDSRRRVELAIQAQAEAMVRWHFLQTKKSPDSVRDQGLLNVKLNGAYPLAGLSHACL